MRPGLCGTGGDTDAAAWVGRISKRNETFSQELACDATGAGPVDFGKDAYVISELAMGIARLGPLLRLVVDVSSWEATEAGPVCLSRSTAGPRSESLTEAWPVMVSPTVVSVRPDTDEMTSVGPKLAELAATSEVMATNNSLEKTV